MSLKIVFDICFWGIYFCSANFVHATPAFTNEDDRIVPRSDDEDIFGRIMEINDKDRDSGTGRNDDHVFLFEGDIEMSRSDASKIIFQENGNSRQTRAVTSNKDKLWPANVPYAIDNSLLREKSKIQKAIKEFEEALSCLGDWRDITGRESGTKDYIYFFRGIGCYSHVGRQGGAQRISIGGGCEYHGIIVHEIGHAIGLWHEQSRPDRDDYVRILWDNIKPDKKHNFLKRTSDVNSLGVEYDYGSIMHYGRYAFSKIRGVLPTIESKISGKSFGQRNGLSDKDKQQLRLLYGCKTTPTTKPTTNPSGCQANIQSDRNCNYWKGLGYCQKIFVTYMKKYCCKTCSNEGCQANLQSDRTCEYWKGLGYCQHTFAKYMKENCCKTCATAGNCKDNHRSCPTWKRYGYCASSSKFYAFMKGNCAKTCQVC